LGHNKCIWVHFVYAKAAISALSDPQIV